MREAVVVASSRTPLAKSQRGSFNMTLPSDLAAHCINDVLGKAPQLDPKEVEDVILGCGQPHGAQGHNIARVAAIRAGLPVTRGRADHQPLLLVGPATPSRWPPTTSSTTVWTWRSAAAWNRITMMERDSKPNPWVKEQGTRHLHGHGRHGRGRGQALQRSAAQAQDEYSLSSQQRTARAQQEGFFKEEMAPMQVTRAILDRKTGEKTGEETTTSTRTSATGPTRRWKG